MNNPVLTNGLRMHDGAMSARLVALCFDARDPVGLAGFWASALGWDPVEEEDGVVALRPTDGTEFEVRFLPGAGEKGPGQNRMHLDLTTASIEDQAETVERLVGLGGRRVDIGQEPDAPHVVLADVEGNELCVIEPGNNFLAGCGRLGSITCDGSQEVGYFWAAALGWPLVWDQNEETAIRVSVSRGPYITWGGPPVAPKTGKNRLHLDIASSGTTDRATEVERLISLGATRLGGGDRVEMIDPDGNEFCFLSRE